MGHAERRTAGTKDGTHAGRAEASRFVKIARGADYWIEHYSIPEPMSGCVLWLGSVDSRGLPRVRLGTKGRQISVQRHVLGWSQLSRPKMHVTQKCCLKSCVNKQHLGPISHAEVVRLGWAKSPHKKEIRVVVQKRRPHFSHAVSEADVAAIAAWVDGEGAISLSPVHREPGRSPSRYYARVAIYNTDLSVLGWIRTCFRASGLHIRHAAGRKPCGQLYYAAWRAYDLLEAILPRLRIKRRQAELVLSYESLTGIGGRKVTNGAEREDIRAELLALNRRGVSL